MSQVTGLLDILTTAFSSPPTENDMGRLWLRVHFFFHLDVLLQRIVSLIYQLFISLCEGLSHITVIVFTNVCFFIRGSCFSLNQAFEASIMASADLLCTIFRSTSDVVFTR